MYAIKKTTEYRYVTHLSKNKFPKKKKKIFTCGHSCYLQVFQSDGTFVGKFGSHGNKSGQLEHPHYIAVSNTNRVIVSDSNNHRVQIFDVNGRVLSSFGSEGSDEGQFKFPRLVEKIFLT